MSTTIECHYCGPIETKECTDCKSNVEEHYSLLCPNIEHDCSIISNRTCSKCFFFIPHHKDECTPKTFPKGKSNFLCGKCGYIYTNFCLACGDFVTTHTNPNCSSFEKHSCAEQGPESFDCIYCDQVPTKRCETCGILYAEHTSLSCNGHHNC